MQHFLGTVHGGYVWREFNRIGAYLVQYPSLDRTGNDADEYFLEIVLRQLVKVSYTLGGEIPFRYINSSQSFFSLPTPAKCSLQHTLSRYVCAEYVDIYKPLNRHLAIRYMP